MARTKPAETLLGKAHARETQERWEAMGDNKAMERALAAFVEAYRNVDPGAATPALDDAYDLAKDALELAAKAEGG